MSTRSVQFPTRSAWRPLRPRERPCGPVRCALYDTDADRLVTTSDDPEVATKLKPIYDELVGGVFDADDIDGCGYVAGRFVVYDTVYAIQELGDLAYGVTARDEVLETICDLTRPLEMPVTSPGTLVATLYPLVS